MFSRKFALAALLAAGFPAHAQVPAQSAAVVASPVRAPVVTTVPAVPPAHKPSREAAEIAVINERIAVMAAQLAEMEMLAKIATKESEIKAARQSGKEQSFAQDDSFVPSVSEISGIDGRIWAVLNVRGGNTQTVRVGDRVGGWRVVEIRADSVTVQKGSERTRLAFGLNTPQPQDALSAAPGGTPAGLPPFPTR